MSIKTDNASDIGLVGLGAMGSSLALNMADHGVKVAVYNRTSAKTDEFICVKAAGKAVTACYSPQKLVLSLKRPRVIMLMVAAGNAVDQTITQLEKYSQRGDAIIDGGNSYFKDTERREKALAEKGIQYLGVGVSGGVRGARRGPSLMPGGSRDAYFRVREIFEGIAARVLGEPCVAYLGPGSAGHYVKMIHNGIEYGLMQLIAEAYDLMKNGLVLNNNEMQRVFEGWNQGVLNSYLMEITARIFAMADEKGGKRLVDMIRDEARQNGTGKWSCHDALDLQVPVPSIAAAVMLRDLSGCTAEREAAGRIFKRRKRPLRKNSDAFLAQLGNALYAGMIVTYAQGMAQLHAASHVYAYSLRLGDVARIWRGGCIIRSRVLDAIYFAYEKQPGLQNPLLDQGLGHEVQQRQEDLRAVVCAAASLGIPAPGLMAALAYFDACRSPRLPVNLIQAQRDYFGDHAYERVDEQGFFHTRWEEE